MAAAAGTVAPAAAATPASATRPLAVRTLVVGLGGFGHPLPNTGRPVRNLGGDNHILRNRV